MYKIKKIFFNKVTALFLSSITLSSLGVTISNIIKKELKIVNLSNGVYCGIMEDNKENSMISFLLPNKNELNKIREIKLDLHTSDLLDLFYMPNLEKVYLYNINCLTVEDIIILNKLSNIENIYFMIDFNFLNKNFDIDLSLFENKKIYIQKKDNIENDLYDLYIYNFYNKLKIYNNVNLVGYDINRINQLDEWDKNLKNIIIYLNISSEDSEIDKIIKIVKYVTDTLDYDPEIMELINNNSEMKDKYKVLYYNRNVLGSIFDDKSKYGVCCNFASLTAALGKYSNVLLEYKIGDYGIDNKIGHTWCVYKDFIIDSTFLDNTYIYNKKKESYESLNNYNDFEYMRKDLLSTILRDINDSTYKEGFNDSIKEGKDFIKTNKDLSFYIRVCIYIDILSSVFLLNNILVLKKEKKKRKALI